MATREQAAAKKRDLSTQVSSLTRTLAIGVLAISWIFLSAGKDSSELVKTVSKPYMMFVAALCIIAIAFDLLQYMLAYWQVSKDYEDAKKSSTPQVVLFTKSPGREFAFYIKQCFAVGAALMLVVQIFLALTV